MKKQRRNVPKKRAVEEAPDPSQDQMWLWLLRDLLDNSDPYALLNDRALRQAMRELVKRMPSGLTRPDVATHAFVFAASLERERCRSLISMATWPCHDEKRPLTAEELEAVSEAAQTAEG